MRWPRLVLLILALAAIGLLWLLPPRIELPNTQEVVSCRSLRWQFTSPTSLLVVSPEQHDALERYLGDHADDPAYWVGEEEALVQMCNEARQNQQTALMVVLAGALAALILVRTTRSPGAVGPPSTPEASSSA